MFVDNGMLYGYPKHLYHLGEGELKENWGQFLLEKKYFLDVN